MYNDTDNISVDEWGAKDDGSWGGVEANIYPARCIGIYTNSILLL